MIKRIAIVGPESTGKSSLTKALARHFDEPYVAEYAREYLNSRAGTYTFEDLVRIAQGQIEREARLMETAREFLFCDTNLLVVKIWSEVKFQQLDPWIRDHLDLAAYALHVLTYPDLEWEADPLREDPDQLLPLFERYEAALLSAGVSYGVVKGQGDARLEMALQWVNGLK